MSATTVQVRRAAKALLAAAVVTVPALAAAGSAQAAGPVPSSASVSSNTSSVPAVSAQAWSAGHLLAGAKVSAADAVEAYWTPARMRAAKPVEASPAYATALATYSRKAAADRTAKPKPVVGKPVSVAPKRGTVGSPAAGAYAATNPNLPYYAPTARTSGKVFFTMAGLNYQCSAKIVNSEGADTVWTAGHCVHGGKGGVWATNWQFVPAYDDDLADPRPYGTWTAAQLWSKNDWINNSDFTADLGVAIMGTRNGTHIVNYLGGQGLRVNAGKNVTEDAFGYPAETPFDGGNLYRCNGQSSPETTVLWWSSETIKISCNLTRGSSGGGWLNGYDGNWGWLNGINSRIDRIVNPTIMLSPYFDDTALSLYNTTRYL